MVDLNNAGDKMINFLNRYSTPLITGLFLVSLISGLALFFHVGPIGFKPMHEWLSLVLILPFALHLWKNWRAFLSYFRRAPMRNALILSVAAAAIFLMPFAAPDGNSGPPQFALANQLFRTGIADVAPALGMTSDQAIAALKAQGIPVSDPRQPLADAASAAGKNAFDLSAALLVPVR